MLNISLINVVFIIEQEKLSGLLNSWSNASRGTNTLAATHHFCLICVISKIWAISGGKEDNSNRIGKIICK